MRELNYFCGGFLLYVFYEDAEESPWHLFLECQFVRTLAFAGYWHLKLKGIGKKVS